MQYLPKWKEKEQSVVQIFSATIIFSYIGIYFGIIVLITVGAVLALQQLSQSADNVKRYQLLGRTSDGCNIKYIVCNSSYWSNL